MAIRDALPDDGAAIAAVVEAAFARADEARLIAALDRDGDAAVSLVAVEDGAVVGHILLSPMQAPFPALGLAPLSVLLARQGRGIGTALTRAAILRARERMARALFVLGDPAYYGRFGFSTGEAARFSSPYAGPHFMALTLDDADMPDGARIDYARAFSALS